MNLYYKDSTLFSITIVSYYSIYWLSILVNVYLDWRLLVIIIYFKFEYYIKLNIYQLSRVVVFYLVLCFRTLQTLIVACSYQVLELHFIITDNLHLLLIEILTTSSMKERRAYPVKIRFP